MGVKHRWSSWPGAHCLDCGIYDAQELCCAECDWVCLLYESEMNGTPPPPPCEIHVNPPCIKKSSCED